MRILIILLFTFSASAQRTLPAFVGRNVPITPTYGVVIGNSTIADYLGQNRVAYYLINSYDSMAGFTVKSLAVPGNTINNQKAMWDTLQTKTLADYIIVEIGLNDLLPTETAAVALNRYQLLINDINASKKAGAKVIVSAMTPCRGRCDVLYGLAGAACYQKWLDMNDATMGNGRLSITGVDYRINEHVALMGDAMGNLLPKYEVPTALDHIHFVNSGKQLIANAWRKALKTLKLL